MKCKYCGKIIKYGNKFCNSEESRKCIFSMKRKAYCPHCRKRTLHIKDKDFILCKKCGKKFKGNMENLR